MPCELLTPLRGEHLEGTAQQMPEPELQDIGAVVVPSSRDKEPGRSVGKRKQAYRPYFYKRVVCSAAKVRAYICLLGPILYAV